MGIQDRDYYREGSSGLFDAWGRQGAVVWLIAITTVTFFAEFLTGGPLNGDLVKFGEYSTRAIRDGEIWRFVTPLFLHVGLWHLFFNMLVLYWAGMRIEEIYGSRETVIFYLVAGIFANGINFLAQQSGLISPSLGVGASGAVTAVLVLFALNFPRERVWLFFIVPIPAWLLVVLFVCLDTLGVFGVGRVGIGYLVHLGGALFGVLYFQSNFRFRDLLARSSRQSSRATRPQLRLVQTEPDEEDTAEPVGAPVESQPRPQGSMDEHLEAKLDQILEKMSSHGQDSLNAEEREILVKASELYKKRRK